MFFFSLFSLNVLLRNSRGALSQKTLQITRQKSPTASTSWSLMNAAHNYIAEKAGLYRNLPVGELKKNYLTVRYVFHPR